jgi:DNA-binding transcriptional ArsR family regulator
MISLEIVVKDEDKVFKALADPSRRKVLDSLHAKNGQTLGALCERLDMRRQSASQHVDILVDANLVSAMWSGREKLHFINPVPIHEVYERWVRKFERGPLALLQQVKSQAEGENHD